MTGRHFILGLLLVLALSLEAGAAGVPVIIQLNSTALIGNVLPVIGGTLVDTIPGTNQYLVNLNSLYLIGSLGQFLGIQWFELNAGFTLGPVDQRGLLQLPSASNAADWYKAQPSLLLVNSPGALNYATGSGVVVADINSQVDYSHPSLRGHLTSGYDFVSSRPSTHTALNQSSSGFLDQSSSGFLDQSSSGFLDGTPLLGMNPAYSHGTLCAGLIAVVAPDAMIMPVRAFDDSGNTDLFMLEKAIRFAVTNGAHVINMSFGTFTDSRAIRSAIDFAKQRGVVLIASAGNGNTSSLQYPAAYSGVIAVAATDLQDVKGSFSNYGGYVGVDAPGVDIVSAYPGDLYAVVSGTSFSAPIVAGEAALLKSMLSSAPTATIRGATINIDAKNSHYAGQLGSGRINILKAVHP